MLGKYSITINSEAGLSPKDLSAKKLSDLLLALSSLFADNADNFSLISVSDNCIRLDFAYSSESVRACIVSFCMFVNGHAVDVDENFENKTRKLDYAIAKIGDVSVTFDSIDNLPIKTFQPGEKLSDMLSNPISIKYQDTIYGSVISVGGVRPNIHLQPVTGEATIICECSEEIAKEVAKLLYTLIGLSGEVTKNGASLRMKVNSISSYRSPKINPFVVLKEAGVGKFFENESVEDFMDEVRG